MVGWQCQPHTPHHTDGILGCCTPVVTSVYSTVCWSKIKHQRKHQSSASLAFVRGIHRWPVNSLHKIPLTRKMFPFDDVIMWRYTTQVNYFRDKGFHWKRVCHYFCASHKMHAELFGKMCFLRKSTAIGLLKWSSSPTESQRSDLDNDDDIYNSTNSPLVFANPRAS